MNPAQSSDVDRPEVIEALGEELMGAVTARRGPRAALKRAILGSKRPRRLRWRTSRGLALLAAAIAIPGAVALAATLNGDVVDNFGGFLHGDTSGRELARPVSPNDHAPKWFDGEGYNDQLVIATSGSHHLFMARNRDGNVSFSLDDSIGIASGGGANPFVNEFQGNSVVPLMAGPVDDSGHLLYAGLVAPDVATVELRFDSGPADVIDPAGAGFIFQADLGRTENDRGVLVVDRRPVELVALDADGKVLQSELPQCVVAMPVMVLRSDHPQPVGNIDQVEPPKRLPHADEFRSYIDQCGVG